MKARVKTYLNERTQKPSVNAPNYRYFSPGDEIEIVDIVNGDSYDGNSTWYKLDNGAYVWSGGVEGVKNMDIEEISKKEFEYPKINWNQFLKVVPVDWKKTKGYGTKLAILDSGINTKHQDFQHFINKKNNRFFNHCDSDYEIEDKYGHGTRCAGLICAKPVNETGISGVANLSDIFIMKIRHEDYDKSSKYLIRSLNTILENNVKVISISVEFTDYFNEKYKDELNELFQKIRSNNILIIAAAGDNKLLIKDNIIYPGSLNEAISIGTINHDFYINNKEKYAKTLDFITPDLSYYTTDIPDNNSYKNCKGSSFNTAMVAGIASLYNSFKNHNSNEQVTLDDFKKELQRLSTPYSKLFAEPDIFNLSFDFNRK